MKKILTFVKDTIITGMLVIIPIAVIGVILSDVIKKLIKLTTPLSSKMSFAGPLVETIVAGIVMVLLLGAFLFICGILLKSYLGKSFENWLERIVLERIPFYKTIKGITRQLTGVEKGNYAVVEVDLYGNNTRLLGLHTDTLSDGRYVIYIPFAPLLNIGQVHIVARENVEVLDIPLREVTDIITKIGFQAHEVYSK
jgi:uncharacterized membrane protein